MNTTLVVITLATALPLAIGAVLYLNQTRDSPQPGGDLDSAR